MRSLLLQTIIKGLRKPSILLCFQLGNKKHSSHESDSCCRIYSLVIDRSASPLCLKNFDEGSFPSSHRKSLPPMVVHAIWIDSPTEKTLHHE